MINGIFLINKKKFYTSGKVLGILKRKFNIKKAGIYGILDPLATGVLPIAVGEATKFLPFIQSNEKTYNVKCKLGAFSQCGDYEVEPIIYKEEKNIINRLTEDIIIKTFREFLGDYNQIPPMFSASKYKGKPLYSYARNNIKVNRQAKKRYIHKLTFISLNDDILTFDVTCSPGTYIRTLIQDLAKKWNLHSCLFELDRSKVEPFSNYTPIDIESVAYDNLLNNIINIGDMFPNYPTVTCPNNDIAKLYSGLSLTKENNNHHTFCKIFGDDNIFYGMGIFDGNTLYPKRLMKR